MRPKAWRHGSHESCPCPCFPLTQLLPHCAGLGHIDKDMLKQQMPPPTKDSLVLVCGPPPMYKAISGV